MTERNRLAARPFARRMVVLDVMMPGINGFEVLRRAAQHLKNSAALNLSDRPRIERCTAAWAWK